MIREALHKLVQGNPLTDEDAYAAMKAIMAGEATDAQIGAYITALRLRGETPAVITGSARAMRERYTPIVTTRRPVVDTCGTGGDGAHTINISTAAAFVTAGAGVAVAKHGNRSVSSRCGSADVLESLGVNIAVTPDVMAHCLEEIGIAFLYAVSLHPAMKFAIGPRREIAIRTIFNILGPLSNPASAQYGVLGVFSHDMVDIIAAAAVDLDFQHFFVVHGHDGLDEITTTTTTRVGEVKAGRVRFYDLDPADLGIPPSRPEDLRGGEPAQNAQVVRNVLDGHHGPHRDVILLNAAAAITAGGAANNLARGLTLAAESIDSGAAHDKLDRLIALTNAPHAG
jgi:anthranilate phosphoribosyltransferase